MSLRCEETPLPGVKIFVPDVFADARGFFKELIHAEKYRAHGVLKPMVQSNYSRSERGILRGLHYQLRQPQAKLVMALRGEIFDVAVDLRRSSPHFGKWYGTLLSGENNKQMFIPEGFAHGFCVLSGEADVMYYCSDYYAPADDCGVLWNDPRISVAWPLTGLPHLSGKDQKHATLDQIAHDRLPA